MKQLHLDMFNEAVQKGKQVTGIDIVAKGWTLKYSKALTCFGMAKYGPKVIVLSEPLANSSSIEDVMETLTHEVAHAICGHAEGHGPKWVNTHKAMGGRGERLGSFCENQKAMLDTKYKWHVINTLDGSVAYKYLRKPRRNWATAYVNGKPETLGKLELVAV